MFARTSFRIAVLAFWSVALVPDPSVAAESGAAEILARYAADYAADPSLVKPVVFGVEVGGERFRVEARAAAAEAKASVQVSPGFPDGPSFYFKLDLETLVKLDRGEWNALTAMGKARESDFAPMDVAVTDGFAPTQEWVADLLSLSFHFWTRGLPERIPFGGELTRPIHGGQAAIFYYQPGFRSAYVEIRPGQHVNADARDQTNPFPTLLVPVSGRAKAKIGGVEIEMRTGEALYIPPGAAHEFWNPYDAPAQAILLMFGDGA